ncbi:MAG: nucleotide sugar dehydrogenase [bacterium]
MKICVAGLWHLGSVTAGCLAAAGHDVTGFDPDPKVAASLQAGKPPLFEPGLEELILQGINCGLLRFTADRAVAMAAAEIVWVTFDTPVDDNDQADVESVVGNVEKLFPHLQSHTLVLISSQLPVGTTRRLETAHALSYPAKQISFACSPENLRLGKAISVFSQPDRVVVGIRNESDRNRIEAMLKPVTGRIEWMSVESAEMTKHAINGFLAASVVFANEIAVLCEAVGADAQEVERGLKTDARIGPKAYLGPGAAFAGGTLARDISFLQTLGATASKNVRMLSAVRESNDIHKGWTLQRIMDLTDNKLKGRRIALWGLTYKPGTDTLRRSASVELCKRLTESGAEVHAHDPAIKTIPPELASVITLHSSALDAARGGDVLVVATEWPDYRQINAAEVVAAMRSATVVDATRFLARTLGADDRIEYVAVGRQVAGNAR